VSGQSAISKQVAALESHLRAQLTLRTSRSQSLTEAGRDFYESAVRLLGDPRSKAHPVRRDGSAGRSVVAAVRWIGAPIRRADALSTVR
jgi:DNA-binding transcriptional LysR family regulator